MEPATEVTGFPIFQRLAVSDYGLFPGTPDDPGLHVEFGSGLTLVLGANGLGKTTLITMLYRLCTGPFDISGLASGRELGTRSLAPTRVNRVERRIFASRVVDDAVTASATVDMTVGDTALSVTRSLDSLALTSLYVDGEPSNATEERYQQIVTKSSGLSSFSDWILLLRYITFYFEDRRALVWDPSAQRQILRLLFLPASESGDWTQAERHILERSSLMRNLQYALTREEANFTEVEHALVGSEDVRESLKLLEKLHEIDIEKRDTLNDEITGAESSQKRARLDALRAELEHESAFRDLERLELRTIEASFPGADETAHYLLGKLFADNECLACGHSRPEAASALRERVQSRACVICGTSLEDGAKSFTTRGIARAAAKLGKASERVSATTAEREAAEAAFDALVARLIELDATIAARSAEIDALVRSLPPSESDLHEKRGELAGLRARVELLRADIAERRKEFSRFVGSVSRRIARRKSAVQDAFADYAQGFLLEDAALVWAPHKARIGEIGDPIAFPNFELDLGAANFPSAVRRSGPEQVSESQREFIDLAFRMALMSVFGRDGSGSLIIDAPESSLDAVFVTRAADVLTRFGLEPGNRLIVTSNLIEGDLIPALLRDASIQDANDPRVVDLLEIAASTAATRELNAEYVRVRRELFLRARGEK